MQQARPISWTHLRRFVTLQALLVWQGGFVFYSAFVVPTGTEVLGSPRAQGMITQRVTDWLNALGILWHFLSAWGLIANGRRSDWCLYVVSLVCHCVLIAVHVHLDTLLTADIISGDAFKTWHAVYLCVSTAQWGIVLLFTWSRLRL